VRFARFVERALSTARARGMTDAQIEAETGVRASTYHRWRRGEASPTVDKVRQFCAGLGIPAGEALAALGMAPRQDSAPSAAPMDPDVLKLLRMLEDPGVNSATKDYIRANLRFLADLGTSNRQPPRKRQAS
jgi:transcriptional regulator with XRE-family HTH domain